MYPYNEIRKVPLDYEGITSSAFAVQRKEIKNNKDGTGREEWKECGVVGQKYLLIPNSDVKDMADNIADSCNADFEEAKTFFDGRRYFYGLVSKTHTTEIAEGDDVALGLGFWNSYDGSTALKMRMFLMRLICTNGMMTNDHFNSYRFKHDHTREGYEDEMMQVVDIINGCGDSVEKIAGNFRAMTNLEMDLDALKIARKDIPALPTTTWGKITDRYLEGYVNDDDNSALTKNTMWDFYNACTDVLWHEKKPTVASFQHNAYVTDNLLSIAA